MATFFVLVTVLVLYSYRKNITVLEGPEALNLH
jgi:hypothetical protein